MQDQRSRLDKQHRNIYIYIYIKILPKSIITYNTLYIAHLNNIKDACTTLSKYYSQESHQFLIREIEVLIESVSNRIQSIEILNYDLDKFIANLSSTYNLLEKTKTNAKTVSKQANQHQIEEFQKRMQELALEIENYRKTMMVNGIAADDFITVSPICLALGSFSWAIGIFCTKSTFSTLIKEVAKSEKCKQKLEELRLISSQMNDTTHTLNILVTVCNQINSVLSLTKEAQTQASILNSLWNDLGNDMRSLLDVLRTCEEDAYQRAYAAILEELNDTATAQWSDIVKTAEKYNDIKIEFMPELIKIEPEA